jgi:hypothetical protein
MVKVVGFDIATIVRDLKNDLRRMMHATPTENVKVL